MSDNPFLDTRSDVNPFMPAAPAGEIEKVEPKAPSNRKIRPDGSLYSSDPKERYAQLVEDGKIGPQFGKLGGTRKRQHRSAASAVADMAAEEAERIKEVFLDGIDPDNPIGVRLQAAEKILKIEGEQRDREEREARAAYDQMTRDDLVSSVVDMLGRLSSAGQIAREVRQLEEEAGIVDAEVVEED